MSWSPDIRRQLAAAAQWAGIAGGVLRMAVYLYILWVPTEHSGWIILLDAAGFIGQLAWGVGMLLLAPHRKPAWYISLAVLPAMLPLQWIWLSAGAAGQTLGWIRLVQFLSGIFLPAALVCWAQNAWGRHPLVWQSGLTGGITIAGLVSLRLLMHSLPAEAWMRLQTGRYLLQSAWFAAAGALLLLYPEILEHSSIPEKD